MNKIDINQELLNEVENEIGRPSCWIYQKIKEKENIPLQVQVTKKTRKRIKLKIMNNCYNFILNLLKRN